MKILAFACFLAVCQLALAVPNRVTDLAGSSTNGGVVLNWTTPAMSGGSPIMELDLRYSTIPINALNWNSRDRVAWLTEPGQPLSSQTCLISDLPTNAVYYFALKIKDVNGWSTMSDLALIKTGCENYNVTLAWDQSPSTNVVAYRLYYGTASRTYTKSVDAGSATSITVSNQVWGVLYYFAATAVDDMGLESDYSEEIAYGRP